MSTPTSRRTSSGPWVGIALGVVLLGLVAAFAIGLPKATGDEPASSTETSDGPLTLPATLPGGYVSSDDPDAFAGGQLASQAEQIAEQEKAARTYGNKVLTKVLGTPAATRTYVTKDTQAVYVQAFRSAGGAFAPNTLAAPDASGGQVPTEMKKVGDGACILSYAQAAQGQAPTVGYSQCQVSRGDLTTQVSSSAVSAEDLVGIGDDVLVRLQDQ